MHRCALITINFFVASIGLISHLLKNIPKKDKENSRLSQKEWIEYTKQVWNIPIPNKGDKAFGIHAAIMPEEIVKRCVNTNACIWSCVKIGDILTSKMRFKLSLVPCEARYSRLF